MSEEHISEILRRHGLPESRILANKYLRSDYLLPESEEEASKVKLDNAKLEASQKLSRAAKVEAKKFKDDFHAWVTVGDDLKPVSVDLWSRSRQIADSAEGRRGRK